MTKTFFLRTLAAFGLLFFSLSARAQFSPGKLSEAHAHLEGMNNCTQCHSLGKAIAQSKCLDCHTEIQTLRNDERGYHNSPEVRAKSCTACHSEHHGRAFNAVLFDTVAFDHQQTGYVLEGAHQKVNCAACHKPENIASADLRERSGTYLGLESACLTCHEDYHQGTLAESCTDCHGMEAWAPTLHFDHAKTDFPLKGAHQEVECIDCHAIEVRQGRDFQVFNGFAFNRCTDCHEDYHEGRLGSNCTECHSNATWTVGRVTSTFNHNRTRFPLVGQHEALECASCHDDGSYKAMPFAQCTDCHEDYHEGELVDPSGSPTDCDQCHSVEKPFTWSSYGLIQHNQGTYPLEGAHMATPCTACHQPSKEDRWSFAFESTSCVSCHDNVHQGKLADTWMEPEGCASCHNTAAWNDIAFDHERTEWPLEGLHQEVSCKECHLPEGVEQQLFNGTATQCAACHEDQHAGQFNEPMQELARCDRCHSTSAQWDALVFDHDNTQFPLEGKHREAECAACHPKREAEGTFFTLYKIPERTCVECHGS